MNKTKIFIVSNEEGTFSDYTNWIDNHEVVDNVEEADLVLFAGGEDVSSYLYNEPRHSTTNNNPHRDHKEEMIFNYARRMDIPMLGICRGSQFLCVMAGGRLVQDQPNPNYIHSMNVLTDKGTEKILISSTHHQAQFPYNMPTERYKVIGWTNGLSNYHHDGENNEMHPEKECEIVYYPGINALGIQGHPEKLEWDQAFMKKFMNDRSTRTVREEIDRTLSYCNTLVSKLLNNKL